MIVIMISRNDSDGIKAVEVSGHSGYDEAGKDIVCSAVSAVVQTAYLGLNEVAGIEVMNKIEDGYLFMCVPDELNSKQKRDAFIILNTMLMGLKSIEQGYGRYVSIVDEEVYKDD